MTEAIQRPAPAPAENHDRAALQAAVAPNDAEAAGWALLLIPTAICVVMFVVAWWW